MTMLQPSVFIQNGENDKRWLHFRIYPNLGLDFAGFANIHGKLFYLHVKHANCLKVKFVGLGSGQIAVKQTD